VSKFYTLSLNEKANLRKDLESWRGKAFSDAEIENGFDIEKLIGANCYLNIAQNDKGKSVISAINPLPKGMEKLRQLTIGPPPSFSKWIEGMRAKAVETAQHTVAPEQAPTSDLPF
jgi:hypothetical protein